MNSEYIPIVIYALAICNIGTLVYFMFRINRVATNLTKKLNYNLSIKSTNYTLIIHKYHVSDIMFEVRELLAINDTDARNKGLAIIAELNARDSYSYSGIIIKGKYNILGSTSYLESPNYLKAKICDDKIN